MHRCHCQGRNVGRDLSRSNSLCSDDAWPRLPRPGRDAGPFSYRQIPILFAKSASAGPLTLVLVRRGSAGDLDVVAGHPLDASRLTPMRLGWAVLVVIPALGLLVSGCAATTRYQVPATIREADRRECEERARKEAEAAEIGSLVLDNLGKRPWFLLHPGFYLMLPLFVTADITAPPRERQQIFDSELQACVEVKDAEMSLGPEDPLVAKKFVALANRYARGKYRLHFGENARGTLTPERSGYGTGPLTTEAELLYKQAIVIQLKFL